MSETPVVPPEVPTEADRRRRRLLIAVGGVVALLVCVLCATGGYLILRRPLTDLPAVQAVVGPVPPHYLFSFPAANPNGIAVTPDGERIYVVETLSDQPQEVKAFNRVGEYLFSINPPAKLIDPFVNPIYVALDKAGRVYVVDRVIHKIFIYEANGKFINVFPSPDLGDNLPPLGQALQGHPTYLDSNAATGYSIYDRPGAVINLYTLNGEPIEKFPAFDDRLWIQQGIAADQNGNLYVTEVTSGRHQVWIFDAQGNPQRHFGTQGQAFGQYEYPNDVAVDSRGWLYVSDSNNGRVQILSRTGRYIGSIGRSNGLNLPQGVGIDRDWLYVVDAVAGKVQVFDVKGESPKLLFAFGDFGLLDGQFNFPADIAFDNTGRIYVTDRLNNRVQVWSY